MVQHRIVRRSIYKGLVLSIKDGVLRVDGLGIATEEQKTADNGGFLEKGYSQASVDDF
jgi:hypothetical protein